MVWKFSRTPRTFGLRAWGDESTFCEVICAFTNDPGGLTIVRRMQDAKARALIVILSHRAHIPGGAAVKTTSWQARLKKFKNKFLHSHHFGTNIRSGRLARLDCLYRACLLVLYHVTYLHGEM